MENKTGSESPLDIADVEAMTVKLVKCERTNGPITDQVGENFVTPRSR